MPAVEARCAAGGPPRPEAPANPDAAAGTYTVPAQRPQIEASMYKVFKMVRRRQALENSVAKGCQIRHVLTTFSFFCHRSGSVTPWRTHASKRAGIPPTANIQRHPNLLPIK